MDFNSNRTVSVLILVSLVSCCCCLDLCLGHESRVSPAGDAPIHRCNHGHGHDHDHDHHHHHSEQSGQSKLPEEIAEEEDLAMYGFGFGHDHDHGDRDHDSRRASEMSTLALWIHAMGCSLLVSLASLICLIFLPVLCFKGKPSKTIVDSLAAFGAGAMLGDAFLHQLPHAFVPLDIRLTESSSHYHNEESGKHSHSHDHGEHIHGDLHDSGHSHSHSHSLEDLSIGLSILSGIVIFLLVEKVVRYVEDHSGKEKGRKKIEMPSESEVPDGVSDGCFNDQEPNEKNTLRKRVTTNNAGDEDKPDSEPKNASIEKITNLSDSRTDPSSSNLVFGYLNLFSDGVHNFTDGMALGSAFILHGSVGGWSRTLFLLAHELPQEVGDFGILVRSGFSVSKALFFNFLSALVALAGTALALLLGQDPGQSSLIEGFTAGGFIYISVAGVLPELSNGKSSIRSTLVQVTSLVLGMAVALCISLVE
ncbi:hypothetical protein Sjap_014835 [Stephania japonica]|uniref:IAA-alanine resistance protein 1 n=1 Tax=Stephania japonica TaxID=461633 RepID=A0AAP0II49_9MAGN